MFELDLRGYSELIRHILALKLHNPTTQQYGVLASLVSLIVKAPTATNI
jgi:hypothetical protein